MGKGGRFMKLMNYDKKDLIYQNLRTTENKPVSDGYTQCQYKILCNLIRQKGIEKRFFDFLLAELYNLSDWKQLNYKQMYELIHVLTFWDYQTRKERTNA